MFNKRQLLIDIAKDLAIMITAITIAAFVVAFFSKQITTIGNALIEKKKLSIVLEKRGELLAGLKQDFSIVGEGDQHIKEAFPPSDDIFSFVAVLENLASQTAIEQTYHFGVPVPAQSVGNAVPLSVIDYSITAKGNVRTLIGYLKEFEKLPYFSGISNITISGSGERGWEDSAQATMQARVYTTPSK